jgi:leucyl-tRNA synthetase
MGGSFRFLQRVWTLTHEFLESNGGTKDNIEIRRIINKAIKKIGDDLLTFSFNTAIATLMETVNQLYRVKAEDNYSSSEWQWAIETLLQLLAPFAPHITEELWEEMGQEGSIHISSWPEHDDKYLVEDEVTIVLSVNGKMRSELKVAKDSTEEDVLKLASDDSKIKSYLDGQTIKKTIFVPNKLVNFVI